MSVRLLGAEPRVPGWRALSEWSSAPAQLRCHMHEDALDDMGVVVHAELVRLGDEATESYYRGVEDPCELIWKLISNARLNGRRSEEGELKEVARSFGCSARPDSVPYRFYPEVEGTPKPVSPPYSELWYRVGYLSCSFTPDEIFAAAGSDDPMEAASWYADNSVAGDESGQKGLFQGCFDALTGAANFHKAN